MKFFLPFGGKLNPDNRWMKPAQLIPWEKAEDVYIRSLKDPTQGNKAETGAPFEGCRGECPGKTNRLSG